MLVHHRITLNITFTSTQLFTWVESKTEAQVELSFWAKNTTQRRSPGLEPAQLDPDSSGLSINLILLYHWLTDLKLDRQTGWRISQTDWQTDRGTDWLTDWWTDRRIYLFVHWLIDYIRQVAFFNSDVGFIKSKEHGSGNTALHLACRHGHYVSRTSLDFTG